MYIQQGDLFHGMDKDFVKQVMDITTKESHEEGDFLFREGDPAEYFYILLKGRIELKPGAVGQVAHVVSHAGEAFGWSSLVGRSNYSASATCIAPARVIRGSGQEIQKVLEKDPANGLIFFRRLAATLGARLVQSYKMTSSQSQANVSPSYGTGSMMETEAT